MAVASFVFPSRWPIRSDDSEESSGIPTPEHFYAQTELAMLLDKAIEALSSREKTAITRRFGLAKPGEEETLEQIGQELGVSGERVRQLQERAMEKLHARLEEIGLREFS